MQFELVTEAGFLSTDTQRWVQFLAKLDQTSIRIRQANSGDRESITNRGTEERPVYFVVGVLTNRNRLRLPGGEFSLSDRERLATWIKKVETDGVDGPTQKTTAFGLTAEQLVAFHEKLAPPTKCETKGRRCGDVARDLVQGCRWNSPFRMERNRHSATGNVRRRFARLGRRNGTGRRRADRSDWSFARKSLEKESRLWICEVRETDEAWPVGWPSEETPAKLAPKLFESLNVEIQDVSLAKAIDAIQPRVGVPFLFDYNGMARERIDLAAVKVKYPKGRAMYRKVLDNLLYQGKLSSDLRVDEAGHSFCGFRRDSRSSKDRPKNDFSV